MVASPVLPESWNCYYFTFQHFVESFLVSYTSLKLSLGEGSINLISLIDRADLFFYVFNLSHLRFYLIKKKKTSQLTGLMLLSYLLSLFLILVGSVVMLYVLFSILAICFPSPVFLIVEILYFHLIFSISFSSEFVLGLFSASLRWKIVLYFTIYIYWLIYILIF